MTLNDVFENINDIEFIKKELNMFYDTLPELWVTDDIGNFLNNSRNGLSQETIKHLYKFKEQIQKNYEFYKYLNGEMPKEVNEIFGLGGY